MLVSGGQILAIDKVNTGNTILGDGVQKPLDVNTDLIATTSSVSSVSSALKQQIDSVSSNFDNYYTKEETSGAQQIQDAFDKFKTTQTIVSAGKNVGVYSAYNENGAIVYTVSADDVAQREVKIVGDDGIAVSFDDVTSAWHIGISANYQSAGNYVSADDFDTYKNDVAQKFDHTSAWANATFQPIGEYISASEKFLSANALDEISGKWESVYDTVYTVSGNWNEASAFGANSGKFVTSGDEIANEGLAYVIKKTGDAVAWSGIDLSNLGKIYPITSLTPGLVSATVSAMGETSGYVLSAKEPEPFIRYSISASMMSAWTGIDNDVNYYLLSGANINSNNGISAEYIPEANQWNIGLDKTNLVTYARFHTSNNTYTTSAEITGFAQDDYIGTDIYLDNAEVYANSGLYHVDMQVCITIPGNDNNYYSTILKSTTAPSRQIQQEIDGSYAHTETISLSYDIRVATDATKLTYTIEDLPRNTTFFVKDLNVHRVICSLSEIGGSTYQAGNGLLLQNDTFSVDIGDGLELSGNHIQVKLGEGLKFDENAGVKAITINNQVEDVVETVEKLRDDLDKKITTTYPFAQITSMSDFAKYGVTNTTRMIGQLFAVPIASEIRKDETLLCVNALQNFSGNVSFGIFEYDFEGNGGTGSTYWIADTGTVSISAGENLFPLKYVSNDAHELQSSKLYYAVIAVAANAPATGLLLGSSPAYAQNVNANPKYTLIVSNMDQAIDWSTGTLQGAWFQGYNEQYDIPRLFMMLRNGEGSTPIPVTEPFTDIGTFTLQHQYRVSDIFSLTPDVEGGVYRKIIPAQDVDITSFRYVDYHGSVNTSSSFPVLLDDTYTPIKSIGDGTWTLGDNDGTKIDGTHRVHEFTFTTPVHLTANTAYWFMVGGNLSSQGDDWLITYQTPSVTNDLLLVKSMYNVNSWIIPDSGEFIAAQPGMYLQLSDGTDSWTI